MQAVKGVKIESKHLHEQVEKLAKMVEAYQNESPASSNLMDRLDGLHRYVILWILPLRTRMDEMSYSSLEEKKVALEKKLDRSLATRIVFSTEDGQFLAQIVREMSFSIELTTVMSFYYHALSNH